MPSMLDSAGPKTTPPRGALRMPSRPLRAMCVEFDSRDA